MLGIGCDHQGLVLKQQLYRWLIDCGVPVSDFGTFSEAPVDYPDIAVPVAEAVREGLIERAVLVCGTGLGMAIAANKVPGIFAAPVTDLVTAQAARCSNDAQVISLGARIVPFDLAAQLVEVWLTAEFRSAGSARKIEKIHAVERRYLRIPEVLAKVG
jgi:ribose 5-phosphate isomerase B